MTSSKNNSNIIVIFVNIFDQNGKSGDSCGMQEQIKPKSIERKTNAKLIRLILTGLLVLNGIIWLLFLFSIFLPVMGGVWMQLVWSALVIWCVFQLYRSGFKSRDELLIYIVKSSLIFFWLCINMLGTFNWSNPIYQGNCNGKFIYTKWNSLDIASATTYYNSRFFTSSLPQLYLKRVESNEKMFAYGSSGGLADNKSGVGSMLVCITDDQEIKVFPRQVLDEDLKQKILQTAEMYK